MRLKLLEVGAGTEQLSACKVSLLLGVFSNENSIERFLKIGRKALNVKNAILAFPEEPYVWLSSAAGFKALHAHEEASLLPYFQGAPFVDSRHWNYEEFSKHIDHLGVDHERLICFDLKLSNKQSIGQVSFYDDGTVSFDDESIELVQEFAQGLAKIIEMNADYEELKERFEQQSALNFSKTKFFQIIAHDLRAPFHGLLGFSEVLAEERATLDEDSIQNIADYLHDTAESTYTLLENLLNWAMAEGGRFVYHPINFKLKQTTRIVSNVLNTLAVQKNIQLKDLVPDDLKVHADINMVTSIIQNLVSNALKFTHTDGSGKVTVSAANVNGVVQIKIHDTGIGMTESQIQNIFEPQLNVSLKGTSGEKGTGLGLVLCKRFVDLNQGEISVSSQEGWGTQFTVTLPPATSGHQTIANTELMVRYSRSD